MTQSFELGLTQAIVSITINLIIVLTAARLAAFFAKKPTWVTVQKWFMASILTALAMKMALAKAK